MAKPRNLTIFLLILFSSVMLARAAWYWREYRRDRDVIDWLRTHAILLQTVDPSGDLADLQPLASVIGDARIVGAGEATHSTREHFLFKHRLLRFLVKQKGFRALAFESPWPTGLSLNQYVLGGEGDPERLLGNAVFGIYYTREVLDLVRWMREYNATVAPDQRLEFVGLDMQLTRASARVVSEYLKRVDPGFRADHAGTLDLLTAREMERLYFEYGNREGLGAGQLRRTPENRTISAVVRELLARFAARRERYIAASSADEFDLARQHARVLVQEARHLEIPHGPDRDRYMADNLDWYMARRPGVKVMVWAHNSHIAITPNPDDTLGRHLKDRHGDAYVSIGFVLGSGTYRALDMRSVPPGRAPRVAIFSFGPPPAGTFNALMAATGQNMFAVDLRSARGPIRQSLERRFRVRQGSFVVGAADPLVTIKESLPATHDILIFINRTTPAEAIRPPARRSVTSPEVVLHSSG